MNEAEIVSWFCRALEADGWHVCTEVDFIDVVATRAGRTLHAEAKGVTAAAGLDVDTMFGQLLRRMPDEPAEGLRFAVVVPDKLLSAVLRVPKSVRRRLDIDVYSVDEAGTVRLQATAAASAWLPMANTACPEHASQGCPLNPCTGLASNA